MKKIFYLSVILFGTIFINIPKYIELNNLAIIDTVTIKQNEGNYFLNLKEVIPIKDENGIKYQYEYYNSKCKEIGICLKKIEEDTRKKIYLKKTKSLITNVYHTKKFIKQLKIKPKTIIHTRKIKLQKEKNTNR